jgi:hypothetical protein
LSISRLSEPHAPPTHPKPWPAPRRNRSALVDGGDAAELGRLVREQLVDGDGIEAEPGEGRGTGTAQIVLDLGSEKRGVSPRFGRRSGPAIAPRADRLPMRRSTAVALLGLRCKQRARPEARITIERIGGAVRRIIYVFEDAGLTSVFSLNTEI